MTNEEAAILLKQTQITLARGSGHVLLAEALRLAISALVEQKHGEWINEPMYKQMMDGKTWDGFTYCSECRRIHEYGYRSNFCPDCGADMRGGEE